MPDPSAAAAAFDDLAAYHAARAAALFRAARGTTPPADAAGPFVAADEHDAVAVWARLAARALRARPDAAAAAGLATAPEIALERVCDGRRDPRPALIASMRRMLDALEEKKDA